jgi:hypothetical protein
MQGLRQLLRRADPAAKLNGTPAKLSFVASFV